jgi:DNA-directed RNA polymerase specialized sigma54-like protein
VQALDPPGCATRDYRESLAVQARLLPDAPTGMEAALAYLELLEKEKFADAAKKLGCRNLEWRALKWNTPALNLYRSLGAVTLDDWVTLRKQCNFSARNDVEPECGVCVET